MSDMGFSYNGFPAEDGDPQTQETQDQRAPAWFRDKMDADSKALKEMREQMELLRAENRQAKVEQRLTAQGYSPQVASLYSGEPDKVEEWLTANAPYLVKADGHTAAPQAQGGAPQSTIPATGQAGMQQMNNAGPTGSENLPTGDDALAAALAATTTPEEFQAVARANGWKYDMLA
jgi:hypothetical protein